MVRVLLWLNSAKNVSSPASPWQLLITQGAHMNIESQAQAIHVIGIELRTTNMEAMHTIPPHWKRFSDEGVMGRVPGRLGDEVYAVYTNFQNAGVNNDGLYSLIIGVACDPATECPPGMVRAVLPASKRAVFPVDKGRFDLVGPAWQATWKRHDLRKTFIADGERYRANGEIDILIGIESESAHA
jgi:predicted transcriptional regulator YdeE